MRRIALAPVGFLALVVAGSHCGGASGGLGGDASTGDSDGGGSSGDGNGGSSGSGGSGGAGNSSSSGSGGNSSSGASSSGSSGGSASSSSGGSSSGSGSGGPIDGGGHMCLNASGCGTGQTCCGSTCCTSAQLCCIVSGPVPPVDPYYCYTPTASQPACPRSCAPKCVSDRNVKRAVEPVDDQAVLQSVANMPVSTWSYKSDDPSVRHLGPMAQDFHAAFGLGDTDRAYDSIDAHGVAFAAIKGLYEQVQEQSARVERLERENEELRTRPCVPGR